MLGGVAEHPEPLVEGVRIESVGFTGRIELVELDLLVVQPLTVGPLGGEAFLQLVVPDDPPFLEIDQEHLPGLQPPLDADFLRRNVQHADFARHDDDVVVGHVVAARTQAVPVQHRADVSAVGEGDGRGAVPGLHETGVILVEGALGRAHGGMVLPCLGDHHHDRFRERAAGHDEELQGIVEVSRVGEVRLDDRKEPGELVAEQRTLEHAFPGAHLVDVSPKGVDLSVVRHEPERLRPVPRRECVGGEAGMNHGQVAFEVLVRKVAEIREELLGREHPLVDDHPGRETAEIEEMVPVVLSSADPAGRLLADQVELPFEGALVEAVGGADEQLLDDRLRGKRGGPEARVVGGDFPETEELLALRLDDPGKLRATGFPFALVAGKKNEPGREFSPSGKNDPFGCSGLFQKFPRKGGEHARSVAGIRFTSAGSPVRHVQEHLVCVPNDRVAALSLDVCDETDPAAVLLVRGIVESVPSRPLLICHESPSWV